ncbi:hypothetical protein EBZ80_13570 [bacterium]|nr:hypothetical protein [bacterium]
MLRLYHTTFTATPQPLLEEIPASHAQLLARCSGPDAFDGGRTAAWLAALGPAATWRAVRDGHTGHTIHCVSDRPAEALTVDLRLGLRLMAWMRGRGRGPPLTWYWWDQPWPRVLGAGELPGRDAINGGWAVPGVPEIHVYRREEAHKVLLHECIHALGLDIPAPLLVPVRRRFETALGRALWPHFGEAWTELAAEWMWAATGADYEARWTAQKRCAEEQAGLVWSRTRESRSAEDTNVFAYYVMKWVLMAHTEAVLLAPAASVPHWWSWWEKALPELERLAAGAGAAGAGTVRMGMTCAGKGRLQRLPTTTTE